MCVYGVMDSSRPLVTGAFSSRSLSASVLCIAVNASPRSTPRSTHSLSSAMNSRYAGSSGAKTISPASLRARL